MKIHTQLAILLGLFASEASATYIEVHGHRGARGSFPENTLSAFQYALDQRVDVIELDLQVTKDNQLVVSHDQLVNWGLCKASNRAKYRKKRVVPIHSLTLQEVKMLDCGSRRNSKFPKQRLKKGQRIPTLDEVFRMVKGSPLKSAKTVQFNIEIKMVPATVFLKWSPDPQTFAKLVVEVLKKHGMEKRAILQSFDHRALVAVKELNEDIRTSGLTSGNKIDYVEAMQAINADILSPNMGWITKEDVERLHKKDIKVVPYTANEKKEWQYLVGIGVDGIISDYPKELIQWLDRQGLRKR